ncbi:GIY-YIG nuclease family protein [Subtercola boreus]|uniref:ATPase n=1 Tax=Subtercola boreus TaxID=120213 RepID=A0A3E0WEB1_9MICO|nr:GIY-YIG nuclease family protein [Subtercola boreus]RFA23570.1 ATPase [Subtercola boreus]RFA23964.1 ATPase [Subtercola boreus]RFA29662.1 ATPase [Subtercola boreus]
MSRASCCSVDDDGGVCGAPVEGDAPLALCAHHLLLAHDFVARDVGTTDVLPSPCVACGSRLGVRYPSGWLCAICEWRVGEVPDAGVRVERVEVVYYIRSGDRIKIGTSANPRQRLGSLFYEELLAFERGGRLLERRRHERFASARVPRSEWFAVHPELSSHIAVLAYGVDDPWGLYARWLSERRALGG